jgi:hypothetical protein
MKQSSIRRIAAVVTFFLLWAGVEYVVRGFVQPLAQYWPMAKQEYQAADGTITTAFVGASLFKNGLIPSLFDQTMGGISYNDASANQSLALSYYALEDLAASNPLKLLLIDTSIRRMLRDGEDTLYAARFILFDQLLNPSVRFHLFRDMFKLDDLVQMIFQTSRYQLNYVPDSIGSRLKPAYLLTYLKNGYVPSKSYRMGAMGFTGGESVVPAGGVPFREAPEVSSDVVDPDSKTIDLLTRLNLPAGVDIEIKL